MTTADDVTSWLAEIGEIVQTADMKALTPLVLELPSLPHAQTEPPIFLAARFRRLDDGSRALRLEIPVNHVLAAEIDINQLRLWASNQSQRWVYAHVRIDTNRVNDRRHFAISVEYSLPDSGLTQQGVTEVVNVLREAHELTSRHVVHEIHCQRERHIAFADSTIKARRALNELDNLIGLAPVKAHIRKLAARQRIATKRSEAGLRTVPVSPHLVFTGNPGTGKTTVARLVGKLYESLGLLESGHVVEVNRGDLVAGYVGQTALKTTEVCKKALGGVLFIDEAYSLDGHGIDFGREAVETLLTFMEAHRGKIAVIVAGYPEEMASFLVSNPGLQSRFDSTMHFPDFDDDELLQVFRSLAARHDYKLGAGVEGLIKIAISRMPRGRGFGNAREIRRLFDEVVCNHALTMLGVNEPTSRELALITKQAVAMALPSQPAGAEVRPTSWSGYL